MDVVIHHNPDRGMSRNTLGLIRDADVEPHIIEHLKCPPTRTRLIDLIARMGIAPRDLLREKGAPCSDLGPGDPELSDDALMDAMMDHPILINRPIVVTPSGARLCRPSEAVLDILPPRRGAFVKEDGERVVHRHGRPVATA